MAEFIYELKEENLPINGSIQIENCLLTDEEIIRCRDCKHASDMYSVSVCELEPCPDGKLDCNHFADWDYYDDKPGHCFVEPNGFCAWAERKNIDEQ